MFYKSNSILIGFDANAFNADINNFNFLNLVQSFSFDVNLKNSNQKFLGSSETIRDQYTTPEVNFNLSYIQRVDFFNEFAFGFNIYSKESSKANIAKKFEKGFVLKFFVSLCITSLSNAKFVLVNWLVPVVIWLPTRLSLNVSAPLAAWLGTLYFAIRYL